MSTQQVVSELLKHIDHSEAFSFYRRVDLFCHWQFSSRKSNRVIKCTLSWLCQNYADRDRQNVDMSPIALSIILTQLGDGVLDHPIYFASRKLSTVENNYTRIEREGLAMVYVLQTFWHYLLGGHFQMYTDHSTLKYLVNKPVLGGNIYRWILLFQEFHFELIVKLSRMNVGPNHLSRIEIGEEPTI